MVIMVILAILSGVTIVTSRMLNAKLAEYVGPHMSTFMNYVVGLFSAFILALVMRVSVPDLSGQPAQNLWIYLGGILGVGSVFIFNLITKKLPAYQLTIILFVSTLFAGITLDYFIYHIFTIGKFIGGLIVLAGLVFSIRSDSKENNG